MAKSKTKRTKKSDKKQRLSDSFEKTLYIFGANINALKEFYRALHPVVSEKDADSKAKLDLLLNEITEELKSAESKIKTGKKEEARELASKQARKIYKLLDEGVLLGTRGFNTELLYRNIIINICTNLEILILELVKVFYKRCKTVLDEKTLKLADIKNAGGIDEAVDFIIEKELFELGNKSFGSWMKFLTDTVGLNVHKMLDKYQTRLIEMFERRHLLIHNDGVVNKKYLQRCEQSCIRVGRQISEGSTLRTDKKYVERCFKEVQVFGPILTYCLWYKLAKGKESKKERDIREGSIMQFGFKLLEQGDYLAAQKYNGIVRNNFKLGERCSFRVNVNFWLSLKFQDKLDTQHQNEIRNIELGDKSYICKLAVFSLLGKKKEFFEIYPKSIIAGEMTEETRSWPIFRGMSEDRRFKEIFEEEVQKQKKKKAKKKKKTSKS